MYQKLRGDVPPSALAQSFDFSAVEEEARALVQRAVLRAVDGMGYQPGMVPRWVNSINDEVLEGLKHASPNFKFVVSTAIIERTQCAGSHFSTSTFWDVDTDGSCTVTWQNDSIGCIITVFGLAL